jgi:hypothetical protein
MGLLVVGCVAAATPEPVGSYGGRPKLDISNGTTLVVTLLVNGDAVGTATPGVAFEPIDFDRLP